MKLQSGDRALSKRKSYLLSVIMVFITGAVILTLIESTFRYLEYYQVASEKRPIFMPNPHGSGSYRLKPNLNISVTIEEEPVVISTNSHGMAWADVEFAKSEDKPRIAFVGDSFTFGSWASDWQRSFVGVFSRLMPVARYETLNFGVGGYGIDDMELLLREEVLNFAPDIVVLVVFSGNDFRDTYLGYNKYDISDGTAQFREIVLKERIPQENWPTWLKEKERNKGESQGLGVISTVKEIFRSSSATWRVLAEWKDAMVARVAEKESRYSGHSHNENSGERLMKDEGFLCYPFWSQTEYPLVARHAIDLSIGKIAQIRELLVSHNVELILVSLPYREQVYVEDPVGGNYNVNLPQEYLRAYADSKGIKYCDLLPAMREAFLNGQVDMFFRKDPHLNNKGHELVGKLIAKCVFERPARLIPSLKAGARKESSSGSTPTRCVSWSKPIPMPPWRNCVNGFRKPPAWG